MSGKHLELENVFGQVKDGLALQIAHNWTDWNDQRSTKIEEWKELRNYIFATDTSTTANQDLPWKNSTTIPKLCQIRDNLHAYYLNSLFPNDNWLIWIGANPDAQEKAKVIEAYMRDKANQAKMRDVMSQVVYDYIDYGNCFTTAEYTKEMYTLPDGRSVVGYEGPVPVRISPMDIVFNPTAPNFRSAPKIIRSIKTIPEIMELAEKDENWESALVKTQYVRTAIGGYSREDTDKALGFSVDGFGDLHSYYGGQYVEVLTFKGDYYDTETQEIGSNREVVVIDRSIVVYNEPNASWVGKDDIQHAGWRSRPDNLWAMGPLDNLVGMQYRLDHLENLKADAMDLIVHPPLKLKGDIEPFVWGPGEEISIVDDGDVEEMGKNLQGIFSAQNEIAALEGRMEEYAGTPKQAMGVRTPGEKTAFEVQALENAAGRLFQEKVTNLEVNQLEPLLNHMLGLGRANFTGSVSVRSIDDEFGIDTFLTIQAEDLASNGVLRPIGARHFGERAQLVQNITQLFNGPIGQMLTPHWSSLNTAKLIEDSMNLGRYDLVRKDIGLAEQAETQDAANTFNQIVAERQAAPQ